MFAVKCTLISDGCLVLCVSSVGSSTTSMTQVFCLSVNHWLRSKVRLGQNILYRI
uniref:Uncharacterized protein n=1 Tax=Anguilla anguilla TaxID=7936 RepID=A0A0E9T8N6_ANGAN